MVYLVDYENVKNDGMRGVEFFDEKDTLILFYSSTASNIQRRYLTAIDNSNCKFEICKLVNIGKNALDFYITSKLGEIIGCGCSDQIAIISRDKGFEAVKDYWANRTSAKKGIVLAPRIEDAMLQISDPQDKRRPALANMRRSVNIAEYFAGYSERKRIKNVLENIFKDSEYRFYIDEIEKMISEEHTPKQMYLGSLKKFGKRKGLYIYQKVKEGRNELMGITA